MKFLSLFSGIGGLDLGLERAGWECAAMCEFDPWCREVLKANFPGVTVFPDVRDLARNAGMLGSFDAIVGGFPCQDISAAGKGAGISGARSGLWKEMFDVVDAIRPRWVVAENVPALRTRGADRVLGDLEGADYTCWPFVVGAEDVGAPHRRKRVFILARLANGNEHGPDRERRREAPDGDEERGNDTDRRGAAHVADRRIERPQGDGEAGPTSGPVGRGGGATLGDAENDHRRGRNGGAEAGAWAVALGRGRSAVAGGAEFPPLPDDFGSWQMVLEVCPEAAPAQAQSVVRRVADGLPARVGGRWRRAALRGLGNAVVPKVGQLIGETINRYEQEHGGRR